MTINTCIFINALVSGAPGLVDRVFAIHAGSREFNSQGQHMSALFYRSTRPGYPHPVCSELEKSGIRLGVGDRGVTECQRWYPPYQTGKTVHDIVYAKHNTHCGNVPDMVSYPGTVASLNKHNWNKQQCPGSTVDVGQLV